MNDTSATTPEPLEAESQRKWASDWADAFAQDWPQERMAEFVGKEIKTAAEVDGEHKGAQITVVGVSRDVVYFTPEGTRDVEAVYRSSFVSSEGTAIPIFADMEIEVVDGRE